MRGGTVNQNVILGVLASGWLALVAGWWMVIPIHLAWEREEVRNSAIGLALEKQRMETLIPPASMSSPGLADPLIKKGSAIYQEFECENCHKIGGRGWKKRKGPVLDNIGSLVTAEQLKEKLWDPMVWYAEGFEKEYKKVVMPDNYPELMSKAERDALVVYLMSLKDPAGKTPKPVFPPLGKES